MSKIMLVMILVVTFVILGKNGTFGEGVQNSPLFIELSRMLDKATASMDYYLKLIMDYFNEAIGKSTEGNVASITKKS